MSGNISNTVRFIAAITQLRQHAAKSNTYEEDGRDRCALSRGANGSGFGAIKVGHDLVHYAQSIGLTESEAWGVMAGWDSAKDCKDRDYGGRCDSEEYLAGKTFGRDFYKETHQ